MSRDRNYIISANQHLSPKLSFTFNLTSEHWESILCKILSFHRAERRDQSQSKMPIKLVTVSQE